MDILPRPPAPMLWTRPGLCFQMGWGAGLGSLASVQPTSSFKAEAVSYSSLVSCQELLPDC